MAAMGEDRLACCFVAFVSGVVEVIVGPRKQDVASAGNGRWFQLFVSAGLDRDNDGVGCEQQLAGEAHRR